MIGRKQRLNYLATGLLMVAMLASFFAVAYREWLRFSNPRIADPSTGHTLYVKGAKGVYYATQQTEWLGWIGFPLMLVAFAAAFVIHFTRSQFRAEKASLLLRLVGVLWMAGLFSLFFFGDHTMSLLFTGSLDLPSRP